MHGRSWLARSLLAFCCIACGSAPSPIDAEIEKSGPDLVTVIEFVDYDCVFCRDLHASIAPLLEEQQGAVRVVLKHVPLDRHPTARRAAFAAVCAEAQGKAYPMHDGLMRAVSRSDDDLLNLAQHVGLDVESFKACLRSDMPAERIASDTEAYHAVGGDGLPMLFIQQTRLVGAQDEATLEQALRTAAVR